MFLQVNPWTGDLNHALAVYGVIVGACPLVPNSALRSFLFTADVAVERGGTSIEHGM